MPLVKLSSAQPLAFGKNSLLQKRYETQCNILDQNRKESQRKLDTLSEQCAVSAYSLLLEAEENEKQKLENHIHRSSQLSEKRLLPPNTEKTPSKLSLKVRPMTSSGHGTQLAQADKETRPSSAQPSLGHIRFSLLDSEQMEPTKEENEPADDSPDTGYSTARFTEENSSSIQLKSGPSKTAIGDINARAKLLAQFSQPFSKRRKSKGEIPSQMLTSTPRPVTCVKKDVDRSNSLIVSHVSRTQTTDDCRKRITNTEMDAYWNMRVRNLIKKWDFQDKRGKFKYGSDFDSNDEDKNIQVLSPETEIPNPFTKTLETEAELRTQKFIHNYGTKYKSAVARPATAPASEHIKSRRRPVKVTRQEMTSIKADIARRKKQTNAILRKSRRIKNHIQGLAEWKHER